MYTEFWKSRLSTLADYLCADISEEDMENIFANVTSNRVLSVINNVISALETKIISGADGNNDLKLENTIRDILHVAITKSVDEEIRVELVTSIANIAEYDCDLIDIYFSSVKMVRRMARCIMMALSPELAVQTIRDEDGKEDTLLAVSFNVYTEAGNEYKFVLEGVEQYADNLAEEIILNIIFDRDGNFPDDVIRITKEEFYRDPEMIPVFDTRLESASVDLPELWSEKIRQKLVEMTKSGYTLVSN